MGASFGSTPTYMRYVSSRSVTELSETFHSRMEKFVYRFWERGQDRAG
jgi:hypothetical protein